MKKLCIVLILGALTACSGPVERVKTSINAYWWHANRFEEACPTYDSKDCPALKNKAEALKRWNKAIKEATEAVDRGGKLPLQLESLKDVEKQTKEAK